MPAMERPLYALVLLVGTLIAGARLVQQMPLAIAAPGSQPGGSAVSVPAAASPGPQPLTAAQGLDGFPAWSPDGRQVAFMRDGQIWLMARDGSRPRALTDSPGWDVAPVFAPNGRQVAYIRFPPGGEEEQGELRAVSLEGQEQLLLREPGPIGYAAWSPDGRVLAYTTRSEVKLYDLTSRQSRVLVNLGAAADLLPGGLAWSPDGQTLIFGAGARQEGQRRLQMNLHRVNAAGGEVVAITSDGGIMPDFSPDGRQVVFRNPRRQTGIYVLTLDSGRLESRVRDEGRFMYFHPRWAPDGRSLLLSRLELPRKQADRHLISRIVVLHGK